MTKQKFYILAYSLVCLFTSFYSFAQQQTPRYIQMSENTRAFYEYLPEGYPAAGEKYPLLLFVHGYGDIGDGSVSTLPFVLRNGPPHLIANGTFPTSFSVNNQTFRFIVISPQFTGFPSVNDINNSLNYLIANYPIDINRIYLTGLSMGGGVTWYYPGYNTYFANRLAAIVPVCGATDASQTYASNIASANLPVWATHNSGDPTVSVSITNTLVSLINGAPVPPNPLAKKTIFTSNSHDAWSVTYNPTYKENGLNVYEWMLQFKRNFVVLPVTGLIFNASNDAGSRSVKLVWKTETEINISGFNVQRSADGVNFIALDFVPATAANSSGANYGFTDVNPLRGKNYYRLEIVNAGGEKNYSETRFINNNADAVIIFYPNPVKDLLYIRSSVLLVNAKLTINNSKGQIVSQQNLNGITANPINVQRLPAGIYFAEINEAGIKQRFKFIKE